jgi:hypothetical protein
MKNKRNFIYACARKTSLARCTNEVCSLHQRAGLAPQTSSIAQATWLSHAENTIAESGFSGPQEEISVQAAISCMHCNLFTGYPRWKNDIFLPEDDEARHARAVCRACTHARPTMACRKDAVDLARNTCPESPVNSTFLRMHSIVFNQVARRIQPQSCWKTGNSAYPHDQPRSKNESGDILGSVVSGRPRSKYVFQR